MRTRAFASLTFCATLAVVGLAGSQIAACNGSSASPPPAGDDGAVTDAGAGETGTGSDSSIIATPDSATAACTLVNASGDPDPVALCLQKKIVLAQHKLFSPEAGAPSSWSAVTGLPDAVPHTVQDDVAYGALLSLYRLSAQEYGDTEINTLLAVDLTAVAHLVENEAIAPGYDGVFYLRLRRLAQGLRLVNETTDATLIDGLADTYGRAIYGTYFHHLVSPVDAGSDDGSVDASGDDAGGLDAAPPADAGHDAGGDAGDSGVLLGPLADGILGVPDPSNPSSGAIAYDVATAAAGAFALVDLAGRNPTDPSAHVWAAAAGSVFAHLAARALHPSGFYYTSLVTSTDPDHDALVAGDAGDPGDALFADVQGSVALSLLRARDALAFYALPDLPSFPFDSQAGALLTALQQGTNPLWDLTTNAATTNRCKTLPVAPPSCGSGFFWRVLPSSSGLDTSRKTVQGNGLLYGAIHRAIVHPAPPTGIDIEPLHALFITQLGQNVSFLSLFFDQVAYLPAVSGTFAELDGGGSYTAEANVEAVEALSEQWVGEQGAPIEFF